MTDLSPTRVRRESDWLRRRWWQHDLVRFAAVSLAVAGVLALLIQHDGERWTWHLGEGSSLEMTPNRLVLYLVGLALLLVLPRVSYRRRDVLLLLLPIVNVVLVVKWAYRLMLLPRRDWVPRPDELPRAVRIPGGRGQWFVARDFEEAEWYRGRWCRNVSHAHPYAAWEDAQHVGCRQDGR